MVVNDDDVYEDEVELEKFLRRLFVLLFVCTELVSSSESSSSVVLLAFNNIFKRRFLAARPGLPDELLALLVVD